MARHSGPHPPPHNVSAGHPPTGLAQVCSGFDALREVSLLERLRGQNSELYLITGTTRVNKLYYTGYSSTMLFKEQRIGQIAVTILVNIYRSEHLSRVGNVHSQPCSERSCFLSSLPYQPSRQFRLKLTAE